MRRARVEQLVMVNWRGLFYERFLFDRGVTALEGNNGAGKTTVMIAAYVVLLPDKNHLRFEPLTETAARSKDRGLWGRLGARGDAWSALVFRLGSGERLVAGVRLERTTKTGGELHPFLIEGLPDEVSFQHVFLDEVEGQQHVVDFPRLRERVAVAGGRLSPKRLTVADYLRALFDAGVTPLPMASGDERAKLNQLLKTSMTGGISRQLGEGLRHFLLRPDENLGSTMRRIQGNLAECRESRLTVMNAERTEREVQEVLEAGLHMFSAAIEGARRQAEERTAKTNEAREASQRAALAHADLLSQLLGARDAQRRASEAEHEAEELQEAARSLRARVKQAHDLWVDLTGSQAERDRASAEASRLQAIHAETKDALEEAEARVRRQEEEFRATSSTMADIQKGLERLHQKASRYRAVLAALVRARAALPGLEFEDIEARSVLARCEREALAATRLLVEAQGLLDTAGEREAQFRRVHAALVGLIDEALPDPDAFQRARQLLTTLRDLDNLADRVPELRRERARVRNLSLDQERARDRARELSTEDCPLESSVALRDALAHAVRDAHQANEEVESSKSQVADLARQRREQQEHIDRLQQQAVLRSRLETACDALGLEWGVQIRSATDLTDLLGALQEGRAHAQVRQEGLRKRVSSLSEELSRLREGIGDHPQALLDVAEQIDARLLAERFDEVPLASAASVEATLGPLVQALLVDDVDAAIAQLVAVDAAPSTVYLVDGAHSRLAPGALPEARAVGAHLVLGEGHGTRLTRLPEAPVVGRQAREQRIQELQGARQGVEEELRVAREEVARATAALDVIEDLLPRAAMLDEPDPRELLADAMSHAGRLETTHGRAERQLKQAGDRAAACRDRRYALEALWPDAALLDPPEHAVEHERLDAALREAVEAEQRVRAVASARKIVHEGLDHLRTPPPSAADREELRRQVRDAAARRDAWLAPQADLRAVSGDLDALGFGDAERKIREDEDLLDSLRSEVDEAEQALVAAREGRDARKVEEQAAQERARDAAADLLGWQSKLERLADDLALLEVHDPSAEALAEAEAELVRARDAQRDARVRSREAGESVAALEPQVARAEADKAEAEALLADREAQSRPTQQRWDALRAQCDELGLLAAAQGDDALGEVVGKASIEVFQLRDRWRALLLERLKHAEDGPVLAQRISEVLDSAQEVAGERHLQSWIDTRRWLARRVPKHVSEVDDPVAALRKLQAYLQAMRLRLEEAELRLQGSSADVARAIEGRLRKVNNLLHRLERDLRGTGFGGVAEIRIQSERVPRMQEVLQALSAPTEQQRLFRPGVTIEEALDELFTSHGGRQGGGQRLLDYREYVRLRVEIRRRESDTWERVQGTELSTGEAIGVGAAIMMVVLATWEREANLLRARRNTGTLRLLFLDEANRLDPESLGTLFDLCHALELQLLIAAPEVERAAGNTTYLLHRAKNQAGRMEVRVTGRRAIESPS